MTQHFIYNEDIKSKDLYSIYFNHLLKKFIKKRAFNVLLVTIFSSNFSIYLETTKTAGGVYE